jgi:EAL and modified HD-GYP domain-containing signal transduction protein
MTTQTTSSQAHEEHEENVPLLDIRHRFVVRHPVLLPDKRIYGYELLYRDGLAACFTSPGLEQGTASSVNSSVLMGFDLLCNGSLAFLPCNMDVLRNDFVLLLPPASTVVELSEEIPADESTIAACTRLKEAGYQIALRKFTVDDPRLALVDLADILKVDFPLLGVEKSSALRRKHEKRCRMLAENLESQKNFEAAKMAGFFYFQGTFFRKTDVLAVSRPSANGFKYFKMLQAASRPELDLREIEELIESEPSAAYRLLRYLNSSRFSFAEPINTVAQALNMLGTRETRHWVRLTATLCAGQHKPSVLILSALTRARFCELIGPQVLAGETDLFLLGMLSLMDVIIDLPMPRVLEGLPLSQDFRLTLLGGETQLRPVYQLMLAQEAGDWAALSALAEQFHLNETSLAKDYWQAMQWAQQLTGE